MYGRKRCENATSGLEFFWKRRKKVAFSNEYGYVWTGPYCFFYELLIGPQSTFSECIVIFLKSDWSILSKCPRLHKWHYNSSWTKYTVEQYLKAVPFAFNIFCLELRIFLFCRLWHSVWEWMGYYSGTRDSNLNNTAFCQNFCIYVEHIVGKLCPTTKWRQFISTWRA